MSFTFQNIPDLSNPVTTRSVLQDLLNKLGVYLDRMVTRSTDKLNIRSYSHTLTSAEATAGSYQFTGLTIITLANVRALYAVLYRPSATAVYSDPGVFIAQTRIDSATTITITKNSAWVTGDIISVTLTEAM